MWSNRHPAWRSRLTSSRPRASRLCPVSSTISSCHRGRLSSTPTGAASPAISVYVFRLAMAPSHRALSKNVPWICVHARPGAGSALSTDRSVVGSVQQRLPSHQACRFTEFLQRRSLLRPRILRPRLRHRAQELAVLPQLGPGPGPAVRLAFLPELASCQAPSSEVGPHARVSLPSCDALPCVLTLEFLSYS